METGLVGPQPSVVGDVKILKSQYIVTLEHKCTRTCNFPEFLPAVGVELGAVCCSCEIEAESAVD